MTDKLFWVEQLSRPITIPFISNALYKINGEIWIFDYSLLHLDTKTIFLCFRNKKTGQKKVMSQEDILEIQNINGFDLQQ